MKKDYYLKEIAIIIVDKEWSVVITRAKLASKQHIM